MADIPKFRLPWPGWGPRKLRENFKATEDAINLRTPIGGIGVDTDQRPDGIMVAASLGASGGLQAAPSRGGGGGSGGTPVDVYGAYNGAPALFHLLQSSAPTPL